MHLEEVVWNEYQPLVKKSAIFIDKMKTPIADYPALGIISELGEVADLIKVKIRKGLPLDSIDKEKAIDELSDVLWYVVAREVCHGVNTFGRHQRLNKTYTNPFDKEVANSASEADRIKAIVHYLSTWDSDDNYCTIQSLANLLRLNVTLKDLAIHNFRKIEKRLAEGSVHDKDKRKP